MNLITPAIKGSPDDLKKLRSKYNQPSEVSLEDLNCTVQALRQTNRTYFESYRKLITGFSLKVDTNQTAKPNLLLPSLYFSDCVNRELNDLI